MRILTRYLAREFFRLVGVCLLVFVSLYLFIDFAQKVDDVLEAHAAFRPALLYFLYKIPLIVVQMLPVSTLIAAVVLFSLMKKNNEVTALKACGTNVAALSRPLVWAACFLALVIFLLSEIVVPYTSSRSAEIWNVEINKRHPQGPTTRAHIWYKRPRAIYWIRHLDAESKVMEDAAFYFFDEAFRVVKRIDAKRAVWTGRGWKVQDGLLQTKGEGGLYQTTPFAERELEIPERPEDFLRVERRPEEMGYWQLKRTASKTQQEGYDATRYIVDMHVKLSFPLITVVMVLMAIPVALGVRRGGTPLAVSLGVGVCFLYLLVLGLSRSLGLSGVLPAPLAAWLANGIFFLMGLYLMMRIDT